MKITQVSENIKIAFDSIKSQLLRTVLTVFIISIGITALVAILSVINALQATLERDFASMGANTFTISRYDNDFRAQGSGEVQKINPIITFAQAKAFKDELNNGFTQTSISFFASSTAEIKYENQKTDPEVSVLGVDENYLNNSGLQLEQGRDFLPTDIQNNVRVCILGSSFKNKLLKDVNPIDKTISVRGAKFRVIGILEEKGSTFGNSQDNRVIIPIQIARSMYSMPNINYTISIKTTNKDLLETAIDDATLTFRNIRKLSPREKSDFGIRRSDDLINRISETTGVITVAGVVIGIITIVGSSIALLNIMLVSVTERTREIGIRKALGAKRKAISFQFFMETLVIAQLGAIFGIVFGVLIGVAVANIANFTFAIPWTAMISAVIVSFLIAIISGVAPAIKASGLDPVEALRYE